MDDKNFKVQLKNDRVNDSEYTLKNSEVIKWTKYFQNRADISTVFKDVKQYTAKPTKKNATILGANWLLFCEWLPSFLTLSTAKVDDNLIRHYLIQVAFEELGCRKTDEIHCHMFEELLYKIGLKKSDLKSIASVTKNNIYNELQDAIHQANSNSEILGLNLGMEVIAEDNIEMLFSLLSYSEESEKILHASLFFKMHRVIEEEHIRISISNFLRFCNNENDIELFKKGFDASIEFWSSFWSKNGSLFKFLSIEN